MTKPSSLCPVPMAQIFNTNRAFNLDRTNSLLSQCPPALDIKICRWKPSSPLSIGLHMLRSFSSSAQQMADLKLSSRIAPFGPPWIVFLVTLALVIVPSSGLLSRQPHYGLAQRVNADGPYIGLVMADADEEAALIATGAFTPRPDLPPLEFYGVTVQILLDVFDVSGIVHYGTAGSANDNLTIGDVSVPKFLAFTGSWIWTKAVRGYESQTAELEFGAFNLPTKGSNALGKLEFITEEYFSVGNEMKEVFWLELNSTWYNAAEQLQDLVLERCINETSCLSESPKLIAGLKASTGDAVVDNAAYREFLFQTFEVATVDEESAAVAMTAMSSNTPIIVFRGISDLAGGAAAKRLSISVSPLAAINAVKAAIEFIRLVGNSTGTISSH